MKTWLRYGLLAGGLICVPMFLPHFVFGTRPEWLRISEVVGYGSMLLCLSATWFAMRAEQARRGPLSYGGALAVGIGVTTVAALLFGAATWIFCALAGDALPEALMAYYTDSIRQGGGSAEAIARKLAELEQMRPLLYNHPLQGALMAATVFLLGAFESLVGAFLVTRPGAQAPASSNRAEA